MNQKLYYSRRSGAPGEICSESGKSGKPNIAQSEFANVVLEQCK